MKRSRALVNLTNATNKNLKPPPIKRKNFIQPLTPSENTNNEGNNSAMNIIAALEKYIKDNYTIVTQENKPMNGTALRISIKPRKYKRIIDGKIFDRVYSSEANLWYPYGDVYIMDTLGAKEYNNTNIPVNMKSLKLRKTRKALRKSKKTRKL